MIDSSSCRIMQIRLITEFYAIKTQNLSSCLDSLWQGGGGLSSLVDHILQIALSIIYLYLLKERAKRAKPVRYIRTGLYLVEQEQRRRKLRLFSLLRAFTSWQNNYHHGRRYWRNYAWQRHHISQSWPKGYLPLRPNPDQRQKDWFLQGPRQTLWVQSRQRRGMRI